MSCPGHNLGELAWGQGSLRKRVGHGVPVAEQLHCVSLALCILVLVLLLLFFSSFAVILILIPTHEFYLFLLILLPIPLQGRWGGVSEWCAGWAV